MVVPLVGNPYPVGQAEDRQFPKPRRQGTPGGDMLPQWSPGRQKLRVVGHDPMDVEHLAQQIPDGIGLRGPLGFRQRIQSG